VITKETSLDLTLEFHYKYLVLLYIEADDKMEAKKHYFGLTYDGRSITRGIETRRHDSPAFIKEFQKILLSELFGCNIAEEVVTTGYQNALEFITQSIDKLMNGEVQITDLVISKLLRQNIEKYRSLFPICHDSRGNLIDGLGNPIKEPEEMVDIEKDAQKIF
jgi:DNA polymerase elongation subunit (family B)